MRWFYEGIKNMPSHYKEKCLPFKLLRKQIDRFLDPSVGLAEQIGSFLALQAGDIPSLYPPPARSYVQPEDSSLPQDISLQVTQFTSLLNLEVEKMNTFLVSTHRLQVRAANRYMVMRQDAESRQKLIQPPAFPHGRVRSKELEGIRLVTFRLFSEMYQLLIFSKINYEGTVKLLL
ncbi:unnamed protein product [Sphagnum balticum]